MIWMKPWPEFWLVLLDVSLDSHCLHSTLLLHILTKQTNSWVTSAAETSGNGGSSTVHTVYCAFPQWTHAACLMVRVRNLTCCWEMRSSAWQKLTTDSWCTWKLYFDVTVWHPCPLCVGVRVLSWLWGPGTLGAPGSTVLGDKGSNSCCFWTFCLASCVCRCYIHVLLLLGFACGTILHTTIFTLLIWLTNTPSCLNIFFVS